MEFKKEDENYIYNVIGKNVKKYRKLKKITQAELAEKIDYSFSFISGLESKKYQTFSLGALWRISLILGVDMYKLCIDEDEQTKKTPLFIKYKCDKCNYETDIPYQIIKLISEFGKIYPNFDLEKLIFDCKQCNGKIHPVDISYLKENIEE
ncbi:MAG: helix-turn-helix transcriptional regulator [Bacilli bacterium]|nr:helix-turn-helix transcriptional regulator [Bacilli bacterium]